MLLSNMETCQKDNNMDDQEKYLKVTTTDFQRHFGRYLALVADGTTIIITKYGKSIAQIVSVRNKKEDHE